MRRQALRGAGALGMAMLQLAAAAALPSADAVLDAERVALPLHVESPHNENCPSSHDHLFCQVVRSLAAVSGGRSVAVEFEVAPPIPDGLTRVRRLDATPRPTLRGPTTPRPPPLA